MNEQQRRSLNDAFHLAKGLTQPERQKFMEEIRKKDSAIAVELESMLSENDSGKTATMSFNSDVTRTISATPADANQVAFGVTVAGRYLVQEVVGAGGFGTVYLALDQRLDNRKVVLKTLHSTDNTWYEKRFQEEVRSLARLDHPGIVSVTDSGRMENGSAYLVMQFVPGRTLQQVLEEGTPEVHRAARLLSQICEALSVAHEAGILHRDLKPANVLVKDTGLPTERAVLIDFGIARTDASEGGEAKTSVVSGTPRYMAPEQVLGRTSAQSDLFSLGLMAAEMFLGKALDRHAGDGDMRALARRELSVLKPGISPGTVEAISKAVAFSPSERFPSVQDFAQAVAQVPSVEMPASLAPVAPVTMERPKRSLHIWLWLLLGLAFPIYRMFVQNTPTPNQPPPAPPAVTAARRSDNGAKALLPGDKLHAGDGIEIRFQAGRTGYLYALDESPSPNGAQYIILFPGGGRTAVIPANEAHRIPENASAWLELDGSSAVENVWLVWSEQPVSSLDKLQALSKPPRYGIVPATSTTDLRQFLGVPSEAGGSNAVAWEPRDGLMIGHMTLEVSKAAVAR